jgi:hypothetical protein
MTKYYVIKKQNEGNELLEVIEAKNLTEARKASVQKHMDIVLSLTSQLVVVGKNGYDQYYK